jgi:hypothetical protein
VVPGTGLQWVGHRQPKVVKWNVVRSEVVDVTQIKELLSARIARFDNLADLLEEVNLSSPGDGELAKNRLALWSGAENGDERHNRSPKPLRR